MPLVDQTKLVICKKHCRYTVQGANSKKMVWKFSDMENILCWDTITSATKLYKETLQVKPQNALKLLIQDNYYKKTMIYRQN